MVNDSQLTCWICGGSADTSEHRIKKADLVRAYGKGPYTGPDAPVHVQAGSVTPLQGPRAGIVKYSPSLCGNCNNAETQPFDRAYDRFIKWVMENEEAVLYRRFIDFAEIYDSDFEEGQRDLFKYFVKSFGCRLVDAEELVPEDLAPLLPQTSFRTALKITFCVNEDILLLPKLTRSVFLGKGELMAWMPEDDPLNRDGYTWHEHVSWLRICFWYDIPPEGDLGSTWIADARYIYLGSIQPLSPEDRAKYIGKICNDPDGKKNC